LLGVQASTAVRQAHSVVAMVTYSWSERPLDLAMMAFCGVACVLFGLRAIWGLRQPVRTRQTSAAIRGSAIMGVLACVIAAGTFHLYHL
jgi:hypothetical protein